jgi:fructosamine-3-kinase
MFTREGEPTLFDPAVYYGHRYMDLGMMQLFGGFAEDIFEYYARSTGLDLHWRQGAEIANLYPLLVHVNLFGAGYVQQVRSILARYS